MSDKAIGSRTHVDMQLRVGLIDPAGYERILPEVFTLSNAGLGVAVMEAGYPHERTGVTFTKNRPIGDKS